MKVIYSSNIPKSRQKKYSPTGTCFDFSWDNIAGIIQKYRVEHGYAKQEPVIDKILRVYVTDEGVTFYMD